MEKRIAVLVIVFLYISVNILLAQQVNIRKVVGYKLDRKNTYDIGGVYYFDYSVVLFPDSTYLVKSITYTTKDEKREKRGKATFYEGSWGFIPDSNLVLLYKKNKEAFAYFVLKDQIAYQLPPEYKHLHKDLSTLIPWRKFRPSKRYIARLRKKLKEYAKVER